MNISHRQSMRAISFRYSVIAFCAFVLFLALCVLSARRSRFEDAKLAAPSISSVEFQRDHAGSLRIQNTDSSTSQLLEQTGVGSEFWDGVLRLDPNGAAPWLRALFRETARNRPNLLTELADGLKQRGLLEAFAPAVAEGWSAVEPKSLVEYASQQASGPARSVLLQIALGEWIQRNADAALEWLPEIEGDRDFEDCLAQLIRSTDPICRPSRDAAEWAEQLTDPDLKRETLLHVAKEWVQNSPSQAIDHFAVSEQIDDDLKLLLLEACRVELERPEAIFSYDKYTTKEPKQHLR